MLEFKINDIQHTLLKGELEGHDKDCPYDQLDERGLPKGGAIGGRLTYCFNPTSIGTIVTVKCACGFAFDCTGML